ncbi:hypothetical protein FRC03_012118 [Tulasnella sp. 419]|nr:hypothetical protein FRC03_012118 [Tulasnella sp. 419]
MEHFLRTSLSLPPFNIIKQKMKLNAVIRWFLLLTIPVSFVTANILKSSKEDLIAIKDDKAYHDRQALGPRKKPCTYENMRRSVSALYGFLGGPNNNISLNSQIIWLTEDLDWSNLDNSDDTNKQEIARLVKSVANNYNADRRRCYGYPGRPQRV